MTHRNSSGVNMVNDTATKLPTKHHLKDSMRHLPIDTHKTGGVNDTATN